MTIARRLKRLQNAAELRFVKLRFWFPFLPPPFLQLSVLMYLVERDEKTAAWTELKSERKWRSSSERAIGGYEQVLYEPMRNNKSLSDFRNFRLLPPQIHRKMADKQTDSRPKRGKNRRRTSLGSILEKILRN